MQAKDISEASKTALRTLNKMHEALSSDVNDGDVKPFIADPILAASGQYIDLLETLKKLWQCFAKESVTVPHARWIKRMESKNHHD
ncbi:hypothetical protein CWC24_18110 [Pseudoalteromonas ruthenica]|nr:hypothetical protein CWC24_18110 [Pseudoalteromonas ruthenica]